MSEEEGDYDKICDKTKDRGRGSTPGSAAHYGALGKIFNLVVSSFLICKMGVIKIRKYFIKLL